MNYPADYFSSMEEAEAFLDRAANYEKKLAEVAYDRRNFNLQRMERLLELLGSPHRRFRSVHIAGTKGKGSTGAIVESCLRSGGIRTGLFSSPHISSIRERMRVNGEEPSEKRFCRLAARVKPITEKLRKEGDRWAPTYFELTTAMSFLFFAEEGVEWAVVEVGLGGRLDATNVLSPELCIITPIGFDHMDKLGSTAGQIAAEKAGILKPSVPLVLSRQKYPEAARVIMEKAKTKGCECWQVGEEVKPKNIRVLKAGWHFGLEGPAWSHEELYLPLLGRHQVWNAASAVAAVEMLRRRGLLELSFPQLLTGLSESTCPARVELLRKAPPLILDTAHTAESISAFTAALKTHFPNYCIGFVFGCSSDKNPDRLLGLLAGSSVSITLTRAPSPRGETIENLAQSAEKAGFSHIRKCPDPVEAVRERIKKAGNRELIAVTGSFYIAGDILNNFRKSPLDL